MEKIIQKNFLIKLFILSVFFCSCFLDSAKAGPIIRVALLKDVKEIHFSIRGKYKIIDPGNEGIIYQGRYLKDQRIVAQKGELLLNDKSLRLKRIRILLDKDISLLINGQNKRYRDVVDIFVTKNDHLFVINRINLEKYVKGVLYHEVSHRWPMEALKAQAVAARTYALYQAGVNHDNPFDVTSDIYSQVYGGKSAERYRTNLAVNRTKDEVLYFQKNILPAYYHSNCGGHTEDVKELWNHDLTPLAGVRCPFCKNQPGYYWKKNFQSKPIQEMLNKNGYHLDLIKELKIIERTRSGRVKNLKILDRGGKSIIISGKKFRDIVGPNNLKSSFFNIEMKGFYFDVMGKGWGHGVGMCQWGMYKMSRERFGYKEILNFYYPGVEIMRSKFADLR